MVEPIVSEEKLLTLLGRAVRASGAGLHGNAQPRQGHPADLIELARDVAAMQSNPDGG
ncbi:MAG: hypothetical protein ACJ72N_04640 [Labedaea sp.]